MHMHPSSTVLLLLAIAAAAATTTSQSPALQAPAARHATGAACIPSERDALLAFKRGITDDPAGRLASWQEADQDCCRWSGVRCSNRTGHVIGLHLGNDMEVPLFDMALAGQISPSLLSLHHLESLDLSANNLSGPAGRVPEFLGLSKNLRHLDLSAMLLYGMVPPQLGNLSKLHYLDLSRNGFTGPLPSEIGMLRNLVTLDLSYNGFTGPLPSEIGMLRSLVTLYLYYNGFTGPLPSGIGMLRNLVTLDLSSNGFTGPLPSGIGMLLGSMPVRCYGIANI